MNDLCSRLPSLAPTDVTEEQYRTVVRRGRTNEEALLLRQ